MDINKKMKIFKKPAVYITWKQIFIAVTVVMAMIALATMAFTALRFLRVGEISVVGMSPYDKVDLMETLAIKRTEFWWAIDEEELEEKLIANHQMLSEVEVKKKLPNRIEIKIVESRSARWYIDISGRKYTLDGELYVIEETKNTEGATKLTLPSLQSALERQVPRFGQSETEVKKTLEIIDTVRRCGVRSRITELDVSNRTDITMMIDGRYKITLGDAKDLAGKLVMTERTLEQESVKNAAGGEIIASTYSESGYATFKPNT